MTTQFDRQVEDAESKLRSLIQEVRKNHDDAFAAKYPPYDDDPEVSATKRAIELGKIAAEVRKLEQDSVAQLENLLNLYRKQVAARQAQGDDRIPQFDKSLHCLSWSPHPIKNKLEFKQEITA
ncbi:hypothetical protein MHY13_03205 [Corynebacterium sp. ACRPE]|uniref:hypothetical protein n=1 Tax=Corynebacterium sp. ACRPE TaxID=2918196 RepID=UPI001EF47D07|nr:hypothetical protein [Corynebacterium sp. ACRPE]MCG7467140.1 hypothetical protein [Corynebacterium sp. ACRPE]